MVITTDCRSCEPSAMSVRDSVGVRSSRERRADRVGMAIHLLLIFLVVAVLSAGRPVVSGVGRASSGQGQPGFHHLQLRTPVGASLPGAGTQTVNRDTCPRVTHAVRTFPVPYLGEVYAQVSANPTSATRAKISLTWGPWHWAQQVTVMPGMVQLGQGGTLILFSKLRGTDGINPFVAMDSSVPVCVVLKTADEAAPRPGMVVEGNEGWRNSDM